LTKIKQTLVTYFICFFHVSANIIKSENQARTRFLMPNKHGHLKAMDAVPHDIGDPGKIQVLLPHFL
jgi:hypothetical protein